MPPIPYRNKVTAWLVLLVSIISMASAIRYQNAALGACAVVLGGLVILRLLQIRQNKGKERFAQILRQQAERAYHDFIEQAPALKARLTAHELRLLVEWWENDDLWIDENAHLLFIFGDGSEWDFVLFPATAKALADLLSEQGIHWSASVRFQFDSRIVHPPEYAGQKYYSEDGAPRNDIS